MFICNICNRQLKNQTGLKLHTRWCKEVQEKRKKKNEDATLTHNPTVEDQNTPPAVDVPLKPLDPPPILYKWGDRDNNFVEHEIEKIYDKIFFWRKNLFMVPTGRTGKMYIDETSKLLNSWVHDSPMKNIAFKAVMIMPNLLLQKATKESKVKDHVKALERRLELWQEAKFEELYLEAKLIQERLVKHNTSKNISDISRQFSKHMQKGNISSALKLLTNNMQNGILPLNEETINMLKQKHPEPQAASEHVLLQDEPVNVHPVIYETLNAEVIRSAAKKTKGGCGPSGLDADGWRRILLSNAFGKTRSEAYAGDLAAAGLLFSIRQWCEHTTKAKDIFSNTKINIATDGKRHLGGEQL